MIKSFRRVRGVFRRHFLLWIKNPEYFFDTFWQPVVDVLIWGFFSFYLGKASQQINAMVSFFLGAVVLWAVLRRAQHEITFSFMEEAWSRNLQNILMTPVGMGEYFTASIGFGLAKLVVELALMGSLVSVLFHFNFLKIGVALLPFCLSLLLTGWAVGLVVNAAIIFFGRGMVALSWIIAFVLQPFACVFYPLSALPPWAQPLAKMIPATWVFEGMRAVLSGQGVLLKPLIYSFVLNGVFLAAGFAIFSLVMRIALDRGLLTKLEW
jgi:ABC-2 type transport system permease protein